MKFLSHTISRILIHLLFWLLFVFISLYVFSDYYWAENPFLQFLFILIAIVYLNNRFLLPFFMRKKLYIPYVLIIGLIAFYATQLYCNYFTQCGCTVMTCMSNYLWQTLVPLIFFSFNWMLFRYLEKHEEVELAKKENTEMELKLLKSQIDPHVLFNNLNTIYSFSLEKPDKVPELVLMLSDNLKHMLYESNTQTVALEKEIDFIDNYIAFQKLRTEGVKEVVYNKQIGPNAFKIAPLILISCIENAFKHSSANSTIKIDLFLEGNILNCTCENSCDPNPEETDRNKIGLENLKKRLSLLYKDKHRFEISKSEDLFRTSLSIDLV
ncbi:hypothetical protein GWK08_06980 [Leptobacterium flavescens]|uniref:Signal transduction histidine kinase internal region domain-containing protein n=1 Tax=Leptobacterium flavescens TaxID=472055 RepID=A0A6P0US22_9FLAO|nr:histidine kinase [Leptobacterium flavescens]NER13176.1 hypothetical protein [Leptobacterium flavescens]